MQFDLIHSLLFIKKQIHGDGPLNHYDYASNCIKTLSTTYMNVLLDVTARAQHESAINLICRCLAKGTIAHSGGDSFEILGDGFHGERSARAYFGGLGAPSGVQGLKPLVKGVKPH